MPRRTPTQAEFDAYAPHRVHSLRTLIMTLQKLQDVADRSRAAGGYVALDNVTPLGGAEVALRKGADGTLRVSIEGFCA